MQVKYTLKVLAVRHICFPAYLFSPSLSLMLLDKCFQNYKPHVKLSEKKKKTVTISFQTQRKM